MGCSEAVKALSLVLLVTGMLSRVVLGEDKVCEAKLGRVQPCLSYIMGNTSFPSTRCCNGLVFLYQHNPVCLCELLSSTGGIASTPGINGTNAILLPSRCKVASNTTGCTALLAEHSSSNGRSRFLGFGDLSATLVAGCVLGFVMLVL